jgi:hypothetical protein
MSECYGGFFDLSKRRDGFLQPLFLSIAVAEYGFDWTVEVFELPGSKRSDEIPGMDNQVAASVVEELNGLFDRVEIIV